MDERERRVGLNESLFREINERLQDLSQAFVSTSERLDLICECADAACAAQLSVTPEAYEAVRADPRRFIVAPGHELGPDVELVVERREEYEVVEKVGDPARVAEANDPRSGER